MIYGKQGFCYTCHDYEGSGSAGPDLTDGEWWHNDGSFEGIIATILSGVSGDESRGGTSLDAMATMVDRLKVYPLNGDVVGVYGNQRDKPPTQVVAFGHPYGNSDTAYLPPLDVGERDIGQPLDH